MSNVQVNTTPAVALPVLAGQDWLRGDRPELLRQNITCLDWSVAKGAFPCAYRWDGEQEFDAGNAAWHGRERTRGPTRLADVKDARGNHVITNKGTIENRAESDPEAAAWIMREAEFNRLTDRLAKVDDAHLDAVLAQVEEMDRQLAAKRAQVKKLQRAGQRAKAKSVGTKDVRAASGNLRGAASG